MDKFLVYSAPRFDKTPEPFVVRAQRALPIDENTACRMQTALSQLGGDIAYEYQYLAPCGHYHTRHRLTLREPMPRGSVFVEPSYVFAPADRPALDDPSKP